MYIVTAQLTTDGSDTTAPPPVAPRFWISCSVEVLVYSHCLLGLSWAKVCISWHLAWIRREFFWSSTNKPTQTLAPVVGQHRRITEECETAARGALPKEYISIESKPRSSHYPVCSGSTYLLIKCLMCPGIVPDAGNIAEKIAKPTGKWHSWLGREGRQKK